MKYCKGIQYKKQLAYTYKYNILRNRNNFKGIFTNLKSFIKHILIICSINYCLLSPEIRALYLYKKATVYYQGTFYEYPNISYSIKENGIRFLLHFDYTIYIYDFLYPTCYILMFSHCIGHAVTALLNDMFEIIQYSVVRPLNILS